MNGNRLKNRIKQFPQVSARPMFGYECFSAKNKFFVGFGKKNRYEVIIRLPKDEQQKAVRKKGIRPFSHGARAGWIEVDTRSLATDDLLKWIKRAYAHALSLSRRGSKK